MKPMQRSAAPSVNHIRGGAATSTAAPAPGRPRGAAVLCSLLFAALWLTGCENHVRVKPEVTITAATDLREPGTPLEFTVRVNPVPTAGVTYRVEIAAAGCALPADLQLPRELTIAAGDQAVTFTVRTEGIEMGGAEGCALTVKLTEVGAPDTVHTVQVTVRLKGEASS